MRNIGLIARFWCVIIVGVTIMLLASLSYAMEQLPVMQAEYGAKHYTHQTKISSAELAKIYHKIKAVQVKQGYVQNKTRATNNSMTYLADIYAQIEKKQAAVKARVNNSQTHKKHKKIYKKQNIRKYNQIKTSNPVRRNDAMLKKPPGRRNKIIRVNQMMHQSNRMQNYREIHNVYVRADVGYTSTYKELSIYYERKLDDALSASIGVGYKIHTKFNLDITATYRGNYEYYHHTATNGDLEHQKISSTAFMINGYFFPKSFSYVAPYLMLGGGLSMNKANNYIGISGSGSVVGAYEQNFAWQIGIGSLFTVTNNVNLDVMYKFINLGHITTKGILFKDGGYAGIVPFGRPLKLHEVSIGLSYNF